MTMKDLAKLANVSVSTVSKAFKEAEDVSEQTRQHIFDVARKAGCYGKFYKGKYPKKIIAVIVPELYSNHYATYVETLQKLIEESNCIMLVSSYHFDYSIQEELLEYYCSYLQVDGVLVFCLKNAIKKGYKTPIVSFEGSANGSVDTVNINVRSAIFDLAEKLKNLGHKRVAFIGEKLTQTREALFVEAAKKYALECICVRSDMRFEKAGEYGMQTLLSNGCEFTAVFCAYDNIAFGAIKQLKRAGIKVPEDISVIGIDNIDFSGYAETSLTTIDSDVLSVCRAAWDIMKNKLKNEYYHSKEPNVINSKLIIRESLGEAKK